MLYYTSCCLGSKNYIQVCGSVVTDHNITFLLDYVRVLWLAGN